jgi:GT2 family glycosyltransferase
MGASQVADCMTAQPIRIVCGTRSPRTEFFGATALGQSLSLFGPSQLLQMQIFDGNVRGLAHIYNKAIDDAECKPALLMFVHDDVHICDFFWMDKIYNAVRQFDIIGLAGNRRRLVRQRAWAFTADASWSRDSSEFLSGTVGHGRGFPCEKITIFGPSKQECKLLDGMMLVADSNCLIKRGVRFDEKFRFHFYDMDFCRQAELKGLRMGTWPISVIHESVGGFDTEAWWESYRAYLDKYNE